MKLDGCFIGACTTAEEDLILGALVLEQAMAQGYVYCSNVADVDAFCLSIRNKRYFLKA